MPLGFCVLPLDLGSPGLCFEPGAVQRHHERLEAFKLLKIVDLAPLRVVVQSAPGDALEAVGPLRAEILPGVKDALQVRPEARPLPIRRDALFLIAATKVMVEDVLERLLVLVAPRYAPAEGSLEFFISSSSCSRPSFATWVAEATIAWRKGEKALPIFGWVSSSRALSAV